MASHTEFVVELGSRVAAVLAVFIDTHTHQNEIEMTFVGESCRGKG